MEYVTKSGRRLTEADLDALAVEAEADYPLETLGAPSQVVRYVPATRVNEIVDLLIDAMFVYGGHKKQWYLDQVLRKVLPEEAYEQIRLDVERTTGEWDEGIAP